jgi:hypothetical protein
LCGGQDRRWTKKKEGRRGVFFLVLRVRWFVKLELLSTSRLLKVMWDPCAGIEATVPMPGKFRRNYIVPTPGFGSVQHV